MAAPSRANYDGYEEYKGGKPCDTCGDPVVISRQSLQFETDVSVRPPVKRVWHTSCRRPAP